METHEQIVNDAMQAFVAAAKRTDVDYVRVMARIIQNPEILELLHASMGMITEIGEFIDIIKKFLMYGKPIDIVNLKEELGDISWYERIAMDSLQTNYYEILTRNVEKLKARYPEKFTEKLALNRNLVIERKILESEEN